MAIENKVAAVLSEADKQAVIALIVSLRAKLPFLISLTKAQRKALRKLGTKRQGYVRDVASGVKMFPDAMPKTFGTAEYLKDADVFLPLLEIFIQLSGVLQLVDDTLVQVGNEVMSMTDLAYGYLKQAAKTNSEIKPVVEKIKPTFKGQGKKGSNDTPVL